MKKILFLLFILLIIYVSFFNPSLLFNSVLDSLEIWLYRIYPSFFIFFIISSLLLNFGIFKYLTFLIKPIVKFNSDKAYELYLLSLFVGNPTSSKFTYLELQKNSITESDAIKLIKYHSFMNPLFVISIISLLSNNYKEIIITYILVSIIVNTLFSFNKKGSISFNNPKNDFLVNIDFVLDSINGAISILIQIAGFIIFCNLLKDIFIYFIPSSNIISSFLESSRGVYDILNSNVSNKLLLIISLLTFQGLSINLQVYNNARGLIKLSSILIIRIIQTLIVTIIMYLLLTFYFV